MKILQVVPYFHPAYAFGGPVKVVYQISKALVKNGHDVVVYTSDAKDFGSRLNMGFIDKINGIKVYRFRSLSMTFVRKLKFFITPRMVLSARKEVKMFDIIHLHEYTTFQNIIIHHYARKYGVPYILQPHGSLSRIDAWRRLKWFYDVLFGYRLLRDASKVIALNRFEADQYRRMGVLEEKIAIIPNGIDLSEYANLPPKGAFKRKFGIPKEKKIILYLGRIHKIKGIDFLIKAYAHLINDMHYKDVLLVIAGPNDGYLKEAKLLTSALSISKHVLFTGPLYGQDKLEAYVDSDVVVLPSRYETFPMTILETYACGKPVIASKVGGLEDLIINGETGALVEPGNTQRLTIEIFRILNSDSEAKDMGLKAKEFVNQNYSIEKVANNLEEIYKNSLRANK
jgi:glycosyltransferase involved in cell wall biosynthesis